MRLRADDITWREIDGDLVVLDLRSSTYLTANASATVLMHALTEERDVAELARALVDAFGVSEERAQRDALAFVDELAASGLLDRGHERHPDPVAAPGGR